MYWQLPLEKVEKRLQLFTKSLSDRFYKPVVYSSQTRDCGLRIWV